jgi:hypothetical protein
MHVFAKMSIFMPKTGSINLGTSDVFKIVFALRMSSFFWSDQTFDLRTGGGGGGGSKTG